MFLKYKQVRVREKWVCDIYPELFIILYPEFFRLKSSIAETDTRHSFRLFTPTLSFLLLYNNIYTLAIFIMTWEYGLCHIRNILDISYCDFHILWSSNLIPVIKQFNIPYFSISTTIFYYYMKNLLPNIY